jgi:hypothetical protein
VIAPDARMHFVIAGLGRGNEKRAAAEASGHAKRKIALAGTSPAAD